MYRRLAVIDTQLEELGLTHRKNQLMLLRRLANNQDISDLQTLAAIVEPVKGYRRYQQLKQNMLSPFTGLIDAAQADAPDALKFNALAEDSASENSAANLVELRRMLTEWRDAGGKLSALIENAPALSDAKMLAPDLKNLGEIGLEIVSAMEKNREISAARRDTITKMLDEIAKPKAGVEFAVVPGMKKLLAAIGDKGNSRQ